MQHAVLNFLSAGSRGEGSVQLVEHRLVGSPQATRVGVLTGQLVFGQRDQGDEGPAG